MSETETDMLRRAKEWLHKDRTTSQNACGYSERDAAESLAALLEQVASDAGDSLRTENARLVIKLDQARGIRLLDGTVAVVGQRVVLDREALSKSGMLHAHDDLVHEITRCGDGVIECGPRQIWAGHLRLATVGAVTTCAACKGWVQQMTALRADSEACRSCQSHAAIEAGRRYVPADRVEDYDAAWAGATDRWRRSMREATARLRTIVDESCGMQPADLTPERLLTMLESHLFASRKFSEENLSRLEKIAAAYNRWANGTNHASKTCQDALIKIGEALGRPF